MRDHLLGNEPKDYDVATNARPEQVKRVFPDAMGVGAHFGVMLVKRAGHTVEIATFRTDGSYEDGRKPESVAFATIEEDASRRDFTINGIFYDPVNDALLDFVGGQEDLTARTLRAIGNPLERFAEDHLRLLRAVRLSAVLGFTIEASTWGAIQVVAPSIMRISPERIRDELDRIWRHPNRLCGFDLLVGSGLMKAILPEIMALQGCEQPKQWHPEGDVFVHTRLMVGLLPPDASLSLVLSVLFHDVAKPATMTYDEGDQRIRFNGHDKVGAEMTEGILRRLRYPNEVIDAVVTAVANHMAFIDIQKMRTAKIKRFMARPTFEDELELHRVDCASSNGHLENYHFLRAKREEFSREPLIPAPLVTGADLISIGFIPGPLFKKMLTDVQTLQLEGELKTREEALAWIQTQDLQRKRS